VNTIKEIDTLIDELPVYPTKEEQIQELLDIDSQIEPTLEEIRTVVNRGGISFKLTADILLHEIEDVFDQHIAALT
jgi:hypothetical protein